MIVIFNVATADVIDVFNSLAFQVVKQLSCIVGQLVDRAFAVAEYVQPFSVRLLDVLEVLWFYGKLFHNGLMIFVSYCRTWDNLLTIFS